MSVLPAQRSVMANYSLSILLILGNFWFGYHIGIPNAIGNTVLQKVYGMQGSDEQDKKREYYSGLLNMLFAIGCLIGVMLSGAISQSYGRKVVNYLADVLVIVCAAVFMVRTLDCILIGRVIAGISSGLTTVGSVILAELLPNSVCGTANAFGYSFLTFAILLSYFIPVLFTEDWIAKNYTYLMAFPVVVQIFKMILMPFYLHTDTPKFIYQHLEDKTQAKEQIIKGFSFIYDEKDVDSVANDAVAFYELQESQGTVGFRSLFSGSLKSRVISGVYLTFAQQLSGINFLIFYSNDLFKASGKDKQMTIVVGLSNFIGSFIALYAISRFGRKFNIVWGVLLQAVGFLLLYIGYKQNEFWIQALSVVIYIVFFAIGLGGSLMAYLSEILPPVGISIALAVQWLVTALIGQFLLTFVSIFGATTMILFFASACLFFFFSLDYLMIETKGKNEDTITRQFENRTYRFLDFK